MTIQINKTTANASETMAAMLDIYYTIGTATLCQLEGKYEIKVEINKIE